MNRIAIFLRNSAQNKFRAAILNTLRVGDVDSALLSSGFFQADGKFNAGHDFDLLGHRGCAPLTLTPLGLYSYTWRKQFDEFNQALRCANPCCCITITPMRIRGMKWHAKVFVARRGPQPAVAVIGSSNITQRAFGEFSAFNRECDVVLWDENFGPANRAVEDAMGVGEIVTDVDAGAIVATYDPNHPANRRPLAERVLDLEAEIRALAVPL